MGLENILPAAERVRVLLIAHSFDVDHSMESRLSWVRAKHAAKQYDVTVLCVDPYNGLCCDQESVVPGLEVVSVSHSPFEKMLSKIPGGFYLSYWMWHRRVFRAAQRLHAQRPFSLVHQVSYCGYREPGFCWQLGVPFVWGPIGGTQNVPWRFLNQFSLIGSFKEAWRTVANKIQLRFGRRVRQALDAARASGMVFAANRQIQADFLQTLKIKLPVLLETGVESFVDKPRELRDHNKPLRVLWVGRLEDWKALPLLLKAIAKLPTELAFELRVVGRGRQGERARKLAQRLGIEDRITWEPMLDCGTRDQHYQWADVFVFTSLRDTSGTGLLESLAAGVPIVGVDHQGARDVMDETCAVPIAVESPSQVIFAMRDALVRLSEDSELLKRLSAGALQRAHQYDWQRLNEEMTETYDDLIRASNEIQPALESQRENVSLSSTVQSR